VPFVAQVRVVEAARRQGVGGDLVRCVREHAAAGGATVLLSSASANEPEPQAWHRAVGFVECGFVADLNPAGVGEVFFRCRLDGPRPCRGRPGSEVVE
jgi:predicted GNAT superfamily acetyltransferase